MKRLSILALALFLAIPSNALSNEQGVYQAVLDYVEGFYHTEPERFDRSLSPDMVKYGYWMSPEGEYQGSPMNFEQAKRFAAMWSADNRQGIDEDSPKEIVVMDVLDKTAVAKLTAVWGIDYFQLEKNDGVRQIRHVIWQSPPPTDG